jgi:hypothetical protein
MHGGCLDMHPGKAILRPCLEQWPAYHPINITVQGCGWRHDILAGGHIQTFLSLSEAMVELVSHRPSHHLPSTLMTLIASLGTAPGMCMSLRVRN